MRPLIVSLVMLSKNIFFILMVAAFSQEVHFPRSFLLISGALAIGTGLFAPVMFFIFERVRIAVFEDMGKGSSGQL